MRRCDDTQNTDAWLMYKENLKVSENAATLPFNIKKYYPPECIIQVLNMVVSAKCVSVYCFTIERYGLMLLY